MSVSSENKWNAWHYILDASDATVETKVDTPRSEIPMSPHASSPQKSEGSAPVGNQSIGRKTLPVSVPKSTLQGPASQVPALQAPLPAPFPAPPRRNQKPNNAANRPNPGGIGTTMVRPKLPARPATGARSTTRQPTRVGTAAVSSPPQPVARAQPISSPISQRALRTKTKVQSLKSNATMSISPCTQFCFSIL